MQGHARKAKDSTVPTPRPETDNLTASSKIIRIINGALHLLKPKRITVSEKKANSLEPISLCFERLINFVNWQSFQIDA